MVVAASFHLLLLLLEFIFLEKLFIVLEQKDGSLGGEGVFRSGWLARGCFPMCPEARGRNVTLVAAAAYEGPLVVVQASVIEIKKLTKSLRFCRVLRSSYD